METSEVQIEIRNGVLTHCRKGKGETVVVPDGVKMIDRWAFYGGKQKAVILPEGLTHLKGFAFANSEIEDISLPESLERISEKVFWQCHNLIKVKIPSNVKHIGKEAFFESGVKELILPFGIHLEKNFYADNTKLKFYGSHSLTLPAKIDYYIQFSNYTIEPFIENPTFENFKKIDGPNMCEYTIPIAFAFFDEDTRFKTYIKQRIDKAIEVMIMDNDFDIYDNLVKFNLLTTTKTNKAIELAIQHGNSEMTVQLMQHKDKLGYLGKDRFIL